MTKYEHISVIYYHLTMTMTMYNIKMTIYEHISPLYDQNLMALCHPFVRWRTPEIHHGSSKPSPKQMQMR